MFDCEVDYMILFRFELGGVIEFLSNHEQRDGKWSRYHSFG